MSHYRSLVSFAFWWFLLTLIFKQAFTFFYAAALGCIIMQLPFNFHSFAYSFAIHLNSELIYRQLAVVLMITVLFMQTFNNLFLVADYYTHTSKYAQYCENKDKPQMHCNGKCQMVKKIQQEESKDQQSPERKGDNKSEVVVYIKSSLGSVFPLSYTQKALSYPVLSAPEVTNHSTGIFHPPQGC